MKQGDIVLILPSASLTEMRLEELVGLTGRVVEIKGKFDDIKGCWVRLPFKHLGEQEWYIPYNSLGI